MCEKRTNNHTISPQTTYAQICARTKKIQGMPVDQYCKWIKNEMNWGGENEVRKPACMPKV